jgi:translation initiation factor IF-2
VIEARMDSSRGPVATVLVRGGTLHSGATLVVGGQSGRVRAMLDYQGRRLQEAGASTPVEILGLEGVPQAGETVEAVSSEREAKERVEDRRRTARPAPAAGLLQQLSGQVRSGEVPELRVILKTDVQGSVEAVRPSLEHLGSERAGITVLLAATGNVTESDVFLAAASQALIVGFNTRVEPGARRLAETERVEIRTYQIIYRLIEDIAQALQGITKPILEQVLDGRLEVLQVFALRRGQVAGCLVQEGRARRGAEAFVLRRGKTLHQSIISSLRHFRDEVREIGAGQECGVTVEGFTEFEVGDTIEVYRTAERP